MKTLLIAFCVGAAAVSLAKAATFTFDTVTTDQLAFDVVWGPVPQGGDTVFTAPSPGPTPSGVSFIPTVGVEVEKTDQTLSYFNRIGIEIISTGFSSWGLSDIIFPSASATKFTDAQFSSDPASISLPTSVTPTPDGYGAHFVFDRVPPVPESSGSCALFLLGTGAVLCAPNLRRAVTASWR